MWKPLNRRKDCSSLMQVKKELGERIIRAISDIGANGAAITEIEKTVGIERHTLSKYLSCARRRH